jgi:hypothetical protein
MLDLERAMHAAYVEADIATAIDTATRALDQLERIHAFNDAANAAAVVADLLTVRAAPGDLDRANDLLARARKLADAAPLHGPRDLLASLTAWIAWVRGDLTTAHAAYDADRRLTEEPLPGTAITGHVVDELGKPVAGARVVTWRGTLAGDATRVYTSPAYAPFREATTDATGAFTVEMTAGDGIIAELGDKRSPPEPAAAGIDVRVEYAAGAKAWWAAGAAPAIDGHYAIAGLPAAPRAHLVLAGTHWPRETGRVIDAGPAVDHAVLHWRVGTVVDLLTSGKNGQAWVFRGYVHPKTPAEARKLMDTASEYAIQPVVPIGWGNTTVAGASMYSAGMHHAVIRDVAPGPATWCLAVAGAGTIECTQVNTALLPGDPIRDRRRWYGGAAFIFRGH